MIHQPRIEVANLFDQLLLMTSNPGRIVYNGRMKDPARACKKLHLVFLSMLAPKWLVCLLRWKEV